MNKSDFKSLQLFGDRLKRLREHRGVSQTELANAIICDVEELNRIESNEASCSDDRKYAIKKFFNIKGLPLEREGACNSQN